MYRYSLIHDRENGIKVSKRNLLPLPLDHNDFFDKCTKECLLVIPIMTAEEMENWNGRPYEVLAVGSSAEVYKWMQIDEQFLDQTASREEVKKADKVLGSAVDALLHSLCYSEEGPVEDGEKLSLQYKESKPSTPLSACMYDYVDSQSESTEESSHKTRKLLRLNSLGEVNTDEVTGKVSRLKSTKTKIKAKGFQFPSLLPASRKPLSKIALKFSSDDHVPDPEALATKAAVNWLAYATSSDMKLLTGCRVSPPPSENFDYQEVIPEELFPQ